MPTLINTTETLKAQLGGIQKSLDFKTIEPFVDIAERRFVKTAIGEDFFNFLCNSTDANYATIKTLAVRATAWYAYFLALPHLRIVTGDLGVMMNQPARTTMAPKWAHTDLASSAAELADAAMEDLLAELDNLPADSAYAAWTTSAGFRANRKSFIRNATQLTESLPVIQNRRRTYLALRFYLSKAEDTIVRGIVTDAVLDTLKAKYTDAPDTLSTQEQRLLKLIADLIAPYALYRAIPALRLRVEGDGLYVQTIDDSMKNQAPTTYPAVDELRKEMQNTYLEAESALVKYLDAIATDVLFPTYYAKKQASVRSVVTISESSLGFF